MAKISLSPFICPACSDGALVRVEIEEDAIRKAKRLPAMVTTRCTKDHILVLFVDGNFQVRDIEIASKALVDSKDAIDATQDWFASL